MHTSKMYLIKQYYAINFLLVSLISKWPGGTTIRFSLQERHSSICIKITFTYFAYICSSKGKLWTFLSSLPWKVPSLIHLFVGYLENKNKCIMYSFSSHVKHTEFKKQAFKLIFFLNWQVPLHWKRATWTIILTNRRPGTTSYCI